MKIVASDAARSLIADGGGTLWVWLDPHRWVGQPYVYLMASTRPLGTTRATRRARSARRPHRFREFPADGFTLLFDHGRLDPPEELHLEAKGLGRHKRVEAYWNGAIFAGEDIPPPGNG